MPRSSFAEVWGRICALAGEDFETITGKTFTYRISADVFYPSRTSYAIPKVEFHKVFDMVPVDGPGVINHIVRGPSYVWAVMHDRRVSRGEW